MKTIESLLISRGELDRIYTGSTGLGLWRALHREVVVPNALYPDFEAREIRGRLRAADVEVKMIDGVEQVVSRLGDGTSLFDRRGVFQGSSWTYFEIPAGTEIPAGLIIVKDKFNEKFQATHYSISPNFTMTKKQFMALLDTLANNAQAQAQKLANG
jgi:hypothetical protein